MGSLPLLVLIMIAQPPALTVTAFSMHLLIAMALSAAGPIQLVSLRLGVDNLLLSITAISMSWAG